MLGFLLVIGCVFVVAMIVGFVLEFISEVRKER